MQNIKTSFTNFFSKKYFWLFLIPLLFSLNSVEVLDLLRNFFYLTFITTIELIVDYVNYTTALVAITVISIKWYAISVLNVSIMGTVEKVTDSEKISTDVKPIISRNTNTSDVILSYFFTKLYKLSNNFHKLNFSFLLGKFTFSKSSTLITPSDFKNLKFQEDYNFSIFSLNNSLRPNITNKYNSSINTSLKTIKRKNKSILHYNALNNIMSGLTELAKQLRWFTRNSLVSEKFIFNVSASTQFKKMFGNSKYSSNLTNNNVWASANLSKTKQSQLSLKNANNNFNSIAIVDKLDNSQLWLFKKIYFSTTDLSLNSSINYSKKNAYIKNQTLNKIPLTPLQVSIIENLKFLDNTSILNKSKLLDSKDNPNNNKESIYTSLTDYNLLSDDYLEFLNNLTTSNNSNFNTYYFYSSIDNNTSIERNIKFSHKKKKKILSKPFFN